MDTWAEDFPAPVDVVDLPGDMSVPLFVTITMSSDDDSWGVESIYSSLEQPEEAVQALALAITELAGCEDWSEVQ